MAACLLLPGSRGVAPCAKLAPCPALCMLCCRVDMRAVEGSIQRLIGAGLDPQLENNPYLCFIYTSFQVRRRPPTCPSWRGPRRAGKALRNWSTERL